MQILFMPQRSQEWFEWHLGRATASNAARILNFTEDRKEGAKRKLYRMEKVTEIISRYAVQDHFVSAPMRAGTIAEDPARIAYQAEEKVMVQNVGIVIGDDERMAWSPDGILIDAPGAIEIKGPKTTTHLEWMSAQVIPEEHLPQLWMAFVVHPGLEWIDFISRDAGMCTDKNKPEFGQPILPRRFEQFTIRAHRMNYEKQIDIMRAAAEKFIADVDATVERIMSIAPELPETEPERADYGDLGIQDSDIAWAMQHDRAGRAE